MCPPRGLLTKQIGMPLHELFPVDCSHFPAQPRRRTSVLAARERPPSAVGPERTVKTGMRVRGTMQPTDADIVELSGRMTPGGPAGFRSPAMSRPQSADDERQARGRGPKAAEGVEEQPKDGAEEVEGAVEQAPEALEGEAAPVAEDVPAEEQTTLAVDEQDGELAKAGSRTSLRRSRSPSHISDRSSLRRQRSPDHSAVSEGGDTEQGQGRRGPRTGLYMGTDPCAVSASYRTSGASEQPQQDGVYSTDPCAVSDTYRPSDAFEHPKQDGVYSGTDPCAVSDKYRPSDAVEQPKQGGGYTGTDPCAVSAGYRSSAGSAYPGGLTVPGSVMHPVAEGVPEGAAEGGRRSCPVTPQADSMSERSAGRVSDGVGSVGGSRRELPGVAAHSPKKTSVAGVLASDPAAVPAARRSKVQDSSDAGSVAAAKEGGSAVADSTGKADPTTAADYPAGPGNEPAGPRTSADSPQGAPPEPGAGVAGGPQPGAEAQPTETSAQPWPPGISGQGSPACRSSGNIQAQGGPAPGAEGGSAPSTKSMGAKTVSAPPSSMSLSRGTGRRVAPCG
ncbi:collagen alpha-1(I) chain-like [Frankliniella occidentalis]|uniref:Collagen alpha-1(I) chain-like n=1 Tax=Frankliniella occidentalis TaxID=133901 RepID=A0A9C6TVL3_FRAOC|nr:collagen alpha-1(I) chain-like [Frankliniella occidentalis]